jgi:N-methylhydantoinase B
MSARQDADLSLIQKQIVWNRLIAAAEEQAQTLMHTAFSTTVTDAGDLAGGVFDTEGRMLAQAVTGTPGHVNSMANAVRHFLDKYPAETMGAGDHFLTNDPWMTSGHLHDLTLVSPIVREDRTVALIACTCHVGDIGGRGFGPDGREIFEEGLYIPILPLFRRGRLNGDLMEIIRGNVRNPTEIEGDIFSYVASNEEGGRRVAGLMAEFGLQSLDEMAAFILANSRDATTREIAKLPRGTYSNSLRTDGYDRPLDLCATMTIAEDHILVDLTGTSAASPYGINVVMNYTMAYAVFGLKCIIAPDIPNNAGSLEPFRVTAPDGIILNAQRPSPVAARHVTGQFLPDLIFGCLHQAIPGRVPAEGSAANWQPQFRGGIAALDTAVVDAEQYNDLASFDAITFHVGGTGARPNEDGLSATAFPSGVRNMPVEITESRAPVIFWRKEYRPDSGGAGRFRGGFGQIMEFGSADDVPFAILAMFDRVKNPARGREGGDDGAPGRVALASGAGLRTKGHQTIPPGDRLLLELPGGGGYGDPHGREAERIAADVRNGLVSPEAARDLYGAVIDADGRVDLARTQANRIVRR